MSFSNSTGLSLGTSGTLAGKRFSVVGRVVMGMEENGETYYWNEFHLVDSDNQSATLVHEVTEHGPQWKLFTYVESNRVWTADEAAAMNVGDRTDIDGMSARVTLVDESRVYFIEGHPPEGVEVGDVARYFNAMAGNRMYVVSWTGNEVEIFRGMDLPTQAIASAFRLSGSSSQPGRTSIQSAMTDRLGASAGWIIKLLVSALVGIFAIAGFLSCRSSGRGKALVPVKPPTLAAPLKAGASGQLGEKFWRVKGHALVEIRKPGLIYDRHEYLLVASDDTAALLVYGLEPGRKDWRLLQSVEFDSPLTPQLAAARRAGEKIGAGARQLEVKQLFRSTVRSADGESFAGLLPGTVAYGFQAEAKDSILLASWNTTKVISWIGKPVASKDVLAAFGRNP